MLVMACMRVPSLFWREYRRFFIEGLLALSRLWGACGFYPGWRARRVHLVFWGLSCWCASVNFTCGFNFGHGLWLPCGVTFAVLGGGLLIVRVVSYGSLLAWGWAFPGCEAMGGLWALSKVESAVCTSTSPSYVYPACKLHWHFTCGLNSKHSLW